MLEKAAVVFQFETTVTPTGLEQNLLTSFQFHHVCYPGLATIMLRFRQ